MLAEAGNTDSHVVVLPIPLIALEEFVFCFRPVSPRALIMLSANMRSFTAILLFLGLALAAEVLEPQYVKEPTLVEFDIVFPRNGETYAPASFFPIVLAVQNPIAALSIRPATYWAITNAADRDVIVQGRMDELGFNETDNSPANFTSDKNPHYFTFWTSNLNGTAADIEGEYALSWWVDYHDCLVYESKDPTVQFITTSISFNIKKDGKEPRLEAPTYLHDSYCPENPLAVRIRKERWMPKKYHGDLNYPFCSEMAEWHGAQALPCNAMLSEQVVKSISAEAAGLLGSTATATASTSATEVTGTGASTSPGTPSDSVTATACVSACPAEETGKKSMGHTAYGSAPSGLWSVVVAGLVAALALV